MFLFSTVYKHTGNCKNNVTSDEWVLLSRFNVNLDKSNMVVYLLHGVFLVTATRIKFKVSPYEYSFNS